MPVPPFLSGLLCGLLPGLVFTVWLQSRSRGDEEKLRALDRDNQRLESDNLRLREALDRATGEIRLLDNSLAAEKASAAARIQSLQEAHEKIAGEFQALSNEALTRNNKEFLTLARETFAHLQQQSTGELEKRQQAIQALVEPLRESLQKVDGRIGEIEKSRAEAYGALSEQLKSLNQAQNQLQSETARLSTALRATSSAGTWGELQLRRVVELAGMTSYCDFTEQESVSTESGRYRPDMVVRLPGNQQIVVDAKAPNEAYREAATATDESTRNLRLAEHATKVRSHIDALGAKAYWEQFQPSPEFVVLFLPGDQFLSGALQADPSLLERAISRKILLATPSSLIALLKAAAYGWRQETVAQNAEQISRLGRELHNRIATFADHLEKVGRALESATKSYNSAVGSFSGSLLPGARKFEDLGSSGSKPLNEPGPTQTTPREIPRQDR